MGWTRFAALTLVCGAACAGAVAQCAQGCPQPKLIPISGHVFDANTGKPIANAEVHFFEANPAEDMQGNRLHEPHVGEVRTAPDGSYVLPPDLPLSSFHVRASAPGYFSAAYNDEPGIAGHPWPADFPAKPSHDLRLEPNHGMIAIGSSELGGAYPHAVSPGIITAGVFADDRSSFLFALPGPTLWLVSLPDGKVRAIPVPAAISGANMAISSIGWDGHRLLFVAAEPGGENRVVGEADAPDFHVALLPTPNYLSTGISVGRAKFQPDRFWIEEASGCDEDRPAVHCGWSGSLVVHDALKNRTFTISSGPVENLSYLLDPISNTVLFSDPAVAPLTPSTRHQFPPPLRQRIAVRNLGSGERAYLDLPGDGTAALNLIAERMVADRGRASGYMTAYTTQGDCDPASTDAAQPFAPAGLAGTTRNAWSLCIVTVPVPSPGEATKAAQTSHASGDRK